MSQNSGTDSDLLSIAWGGGLFVAVGDAGAIVSSHDGVEWRDESRPNQGWLLDVAWASDHFVAVGEMVDESGSWQSVVLMRANDGTWTSTEVADAWGPYGVCWTGNRYVIASADELVYSSDGTDWSERVPTWGQPLEIACNGDRAVAPVTPYGALAFTSEGHPIFSYLVVEPALQQWYPFRPTDAVWSGSQFHIVGYERSRDGRSWMFSSEDAIEWSARDLGVSRQARAVGWDGHQLWVGGSEGAISTCPENGACIVVEEGASAQLEDVAFDGDRFVAVGLEGFTAISANGTDWTPTRLVSGAHLQSVIWHRIGEGGRFIAVGNRPLPGFEPVALVSPDGVTWVEIDLGGAGSPEVVRWNGQSFLALGADGSAWVSDDALDWSIVGGGPTGETVGLLWDGARWIAVCGNRVLSSIDGLTWSAENVEAAVSLRAVAWNGTRYVAVGARGNPGWVYVSDDGVSWQHAAIVGWDLSDVLWTGQRFVAVGFSGELFSVFTSGDGGVWIADQSSPRARLRRVVSGNGAFVALGDEGRIYSYHRGYRRPQRRVSRVGG